MGKWINFTEEQEASWLRQLGKMPEEIQTMVLDTGLRPDVVYLHTPSGRRVLISRIEAPHVVNVVVYKHLNPHMEVEDQQILYGTPIEDLVPCESLIPVIDGNEMEGFLGF